MTLLIVAKDIYYFLCNPFKQYRFRYKPSYVAKEEGLQVKKSVTFLIIVSLLRILFLSL
jgi:hypothetical protein